ncbi:hypothetical protein EME01_50490 [Sinorhizobium meliloti]|nr:hypothetical protein EME01_50490 [Sinorhizobium meliloti]
MVCLLGVCFPKGKPFRAKTPRTEGGGRQPAPTAAGGTVKWRGAEGGGSSRVRWRTVPVEDSVIPLQISRGRPI